MRYTPAQNLVIVTAVLLVAAAPAGAGPIAFDLVGVESPDLSAHVVFAYDPGAGKVRIEIENTSLLSAGPDPRLTAFAFNVPEGVTGITAFLTPPAGWADSLDRDAINTPGQYGKYDLAGLTGPNFNGGSPNFGVPRDFTFEFTFHLTGNDLDQLTEASFLGLLSYDAEGPPSESQQFFIGRFQRVGPNGNDSDVAIPGPPARVPEPLSLLLFGSGMTALWWMRRKRS